MSYPTNDPSVLGFASGVYYDSAVIYPGSGDFSACGNQNPAPARLTTASSFSGPGAYGPCNLETGGELYDAYSPNFFASHPDLTWVTTNATQANKVSGIIPVGKYSRFNFYVGLISYTQDNGTFQQIGKIWKKGLYYYLPDADKEMKSTATFQVLTCKSCPNGMPINLNGPCCENGGSGPCKMTLNSSALL